MSTAFLSVDSMAVTLDVPDAVDARHIFLGLVGHHLRRVRRVRRVVWGFLVLFGSGVFILDEHYVLVVW
jgi:hypothetical protein